MFSIPDNTEAVNIISTAKAKRKLNRFILIGIMVKDKCSA